MCDPLSPLHPTKKNIIFLIKKESKLYIYRIKKSLKAF